MEITSQLKLINTLADAVGGGETAVGPIPSEAVSRFESAMKDPATASENPATHSALQSLFKGELSHADLYQTQFAMNMLKIQGTGGSKSVQQLTQDVESLMKQQG